MRFQRRSQLSEPRVHSCLGSWLRGMWDTSELRRPLPLLPTHLMNTYSVLGMRDMKTNKRQPLSSRSWSLSEEADNNHGRWSIPQQMVTILHSSTAGITVPKGLSYRPTSLLPTPVLILVYGPDGNHDLVHGCDRKSTRQTNRQTQDTEPGR